MKEILIYGLIYPHEARDFGITDGVTDKEIYDELKDANGEDVTLRFNTRGGGADAGFAISTLLNEYQGKTLAKIDGICASAGTIVACGCQTIEMSQNGSCMYHKARGFVFGEFTYDDHVEMAKSLLSYDKRIANLYAEKTGDGDVETWLARLSEGDTYLNAEEAMEAGFVDKVTSAVGVRVDYDDKFQKAEGRPEWFKNRIKEFQAMDKPVDAMSLKRDIERLIAVDEIENLLSVA